MTQKGLPLISLILSNVRLKFLNSEPISESILTQETIVGVFANNLRSEMNRLPGQIKRKRQDFKNKQQTSFTHNLLLELSEPSEEANWPLCPIKKNNSGTVFKDVVKLSALADNYEDQAKPYTIFCPLRIDWVYEEIDNFC